MRDKRELPLNRASLRDMAKWLPAAAIGLLLAGGMLCFYWDSGEPRRLSAVVESADWRLNDDTGQSYPFIEVKLDNGHSVRVGTMEPVALPGIGDRITILRRGKLFDYMTIYEWEGPVSARLEPPAAPAVEAAPASTPAATPVSLP